MEIYNCTVLDYLKQELSYIDHRLVELDGRLDKYDEIEMLSVARTYYIETIANIENWLSAHRL